MRKTRSMLAQFERAYRNKQATFDREMAEQLADIVASGTSDKSVQLTLPESLAVHNKSLH